MRIRCQHLGLIAGLALALSVMAAVSWSTETPAPEAVDMSGYASFSLRRDDVSPVPAAVLFVAGGLIAVVAMVRWRQKLKSDS